MNDFDLINEINLAFSDVVLGNGISLNMTEYYDSGGSMDKFKISSICDERNDWKKITDSTLEKFTVTFSFTDWAGFRFYIPAYMVYAIKNHLTSNSNILFHTVYSLRPDLYIFNDMGFLNVFNPRQINCIKLFLVFCVDNSDSLDGDIAVKNLEAIKYAQQAEPPDL